MIGASVKAKHRDKHRENHKMMEEEMGMMHLKARRSKEEAISRNQKKKSKAGSSPRAFRGSMALPTL